MEQDGSENAKSPKSGQDPTEAPKSSRSAKSHQKSKSMAVEDRPEKTPSLRSPRIGSNLEIGVPKMGSRSVSLAQMEPQTPKRKTPFIREEMEPNSNENQLDAFFQKLLPDVPEITNTAQINKASEQNFEQLSASAETSLVEFHKPETDSETNQTVIYDETAQPRAPPENQLKKLVQNQVCELINTKIDDFHCLSPRSRTHKSFIDVFLSICQNYFVEQSQEEVHDPEEMQAMVQKFEGLIESDVKGSIAKPKCVDILIELLKDENTYAIENLADIVLR